MAADSASDDSAAGVLEVLPDAYRQAVVRELSAVAGDAPLLDTLQEALHDAYIAYAGADPTDRAALAADLAVVAAAYSVAATAG